MYEWDFTPVIQNADLLWQGLVGTLAITGTALAFGLPLGLMLALARLSPRRWLAWPAGFVIEFFRTTPPLVQLFWFFFALPILIDIRMTPFLAAAITFSIQSSAFFAEVFRAGIVSIERGQWEAARAIGMQRKQAMRRVILPQAVKRMIPAFTERAIELMKTTTLVATVSYADLLYQANELAQKTFRPIEVFTATALIYFVVIFGLSLCVQAIERRLAVSGDSTVR
ncbi:amino acid ABC transporter permease [Oceaniglobus ichthyenteri]|uniref:amino acid ABC transporter permease n=1 Tax=Oceaniglobus ichthyenteri TaxID=2136177 RepID=UPI000D34C2F2|nr:amino acid ABC transporter permease [Oceaniglobus ichthyenteri]